MARFYAELPREVEFARFTDAASFHALPQDWLVGIADVVNSTALIEAGRYKTVNMVGAAVVSAVMNAVDHAPFPFVFGGDGAGLAVPPEHADAAARALGAVAQWADDAFNISLRVAMVSIAQIRAAGHDVRVARFQVSEGADYAMFTGGGVQWAEVELKAGRIVPPEVAPGAVPDLTGLSCRWAHMPARHGEILSLVIAAEPDSDPEAVAGVFARVVALVGRLERGGHPAPLSGMTARWPTRGSRLEARAAGSGTAYLRGLLRALLESAMAWILLRTGVTLGGFDARRYARVVAANADFRKLDDGLKMTLDCDPETRDALTALLSGAAEAGLIRFGMSIQQEAMMTCIVPSALTDDHLHFIDGASGGYAKAASQMKSN